MNWGDTTLVRAQAQLTFVTYSKLLPSRPETGESDNYPYLDTSLNRRGSIPERAATGIQSNLPAAVMLNYILQNLFICLDDETFPDEPRKSMWTNEKASGLVSRYFRDVQIVMGDRNGQLWSSLFGDQRDVPLSIDLNLLRGKAIPPNGLPIDLQPSSFS